MSSGGPEHNIIQSPELLATLRKALGLRQWHITPTLGDVVQPVVILNDLTRNIIAPVRPDSFIIGAASAAGLLNVGLQILNTATDINLRVTRVRLWTDDTSAGASFRCQWFKDLSANIQTFLGGNIIGQSYAGNWPRDDVNRLIRFGSLVRRRNGWPGEIPQDHGWDLAPRIGTVVLADRVVDEVIPPGYTWGVMNFDALTVGAALIMQGDLQEEPITS